MDAVFKAEMYICLVVLTGFSKNYYSTKILLNPSDRAFTRCKKYLYKVHCETKRDILCVRRYLYNVLLQCRVLSLEW